LLLLDLAASKQPFSQLAVTQQDATIALVLLVNLSSLALSNRYI
jgi:hypothetical protein